MRVHIPATSQLCAAGQALACEGVDASVHVLEGDTAYAHLLGVLWGMGRPFVLVEDDVVPWPGAIAQLAQCSSPWCAFDYPLWGGRMGIAGQRGLGCVKFGRNLVAANPGLWRQWEGVRWHDLDAAVQHAVRSKVPGGRCVHTPPVGHAQHFRLPRA